MIDVVYDRKKHTLTVKGHSQSEQNGHDLICASASILCYTLASAVSDMKKAGDVKKCVIRIKEGNSTISCKPYSNVESVVHLVFMTVCRGFMLLSRDYPEFINFKIR
jgi:uncharacterized protein YsxB (DUF464 family)